MVNPLRSIAWLCMAFSLGLMSVIVLSYQPGLFDTPRVANIEQQEVAQAVETFRRAMVEARPEEIISISDPGLSFGHSNGYVQTREEFAETVRSGEEIFKRVDLTNKKLSVVGDTAIERHHFSADIVYKGKLRNFELEIVEIWKKTDKWRLLVRQAFKA
ncbi:MAG: nuclear transport factor 2 family protein [Pseudomonadota bacterium]